MPKEVNPSPIIVVMDKCDKCGVELKYIRDRFRCLCGKCYTEKREAELDARIAQQQNL